MLYSSWRPSSGLCYTRHGGPVLVYVILVMEAQFCLPYTRHGGTVLVYLILVMEGGSDGDNATELI